MRASVHNLVVLFAVFSALTACSRERTRVVDEPRAPREENRDYRSMLERVRNRQTPVQLQETLETAIRDFQRDLSRLPTNLVELVHRHYLPELKAAPDGYAYTYDPVHGNVAVVPVSADGLRVPEVVTNQSMINLADPSLPPPP